MSAKKPIWTTTEAHARLKEYCSATGKTQLDVISELILSHLDPNADHATPTKPDNGKAAPKGAGRHFGGVWVV